MSESFRIRDVFSNAELSVVVVESAHSYGRCSSSDCQIFQSISPIAVVIRSATESFAMDTNGNPIDLAQLSRDVPALDLAPGN